MPALPPQKKPATPPSKATQHTEKNEPTYTDEFGVVYVDGLARINISVDVKMSRNYQSCGIQGGLQFTTKAELTNDAIANGFKKLRNALRPHIEEASNLLNEI